MTRKEAEQQVIDIGQFVDSPGWRLFRKQMEGILEVERERCVTDANPHDTAKASGRAWALKCMINWPVETVKALQEALVRDDMEFDQPTEQ